LLGANRGVALAHLRTMALGAEVVVADHPVSPEELSALAADPDVEYVERDDFLKTQLVPNDEFIQAEPYLGNDAANDSIYAAWDITTGSPNTIVAVIDTGSGSHVDLAGRFLPGYDMISSAAVANDGDSRDVDASDPGDWVTAADVGAAFSGLDCTVHQSTWHGTAVAGIIAANTNDKIWTAGVNWSAKILPVRVLGKCGGYFSDILDGVAWAAGLGVPGVPPNPYPAQIINLSIGGDQPCSLTGQIIIAAALANGITKAIVVAAGNDSEDVSNSEPANCPGVIAVAATTTTGSRTTYTNYGAGITISAPGGNNRPTVGQGTGEIVLIDTGTTVPQGSGFGYYSGTSFSAPIVSGILSLVLSVAPDISADQLKQLLVSSAKPFPAGSTCTTATCGAGIADAHAAVLAGQALAGAPLNYQGLWFNPAESGWGINFAHQGDTIFASWYTYDLNGKPTWLVMTANKTTGNTYTGQLFQGTGPAFDSVPFRPLGSPGGAVIGGLGGTATVTFTDANNAMFTYTVTGTASQAKAITRQLFGPQPVCTFGAQANLALATNYTDLWWASPAGSEAGWGVNLTHQGDNIFISWFTFDHDGTPMWLVATAAKTAPNTYVATQLFRLTSGPAFNAVPFPPLGSPGGPTGPLAGVGTAQLVFSSGNAADFSYVVSGVSQTKAITREVFVTPGTVCN
jgi:serine protease